MMARSYLFSLALFLGFTISSVLSQSALPKTALVSKGVVVESLLIHLEGERAGLKEGDILLAWRQGNAKGEFESPVDLPFVRLERGSRGVVQLEGLRGAERRTWTLPSDSWGILARPIFQGELLRAYQEERELLRTGNIDRVIEHREQAVALTRRSGIPWLTSWFLSHSALVLYFQQHWEGYDDAYEEAIQEATNANPAVRPELLRECAARFHV